jgi:hypothetical protein
MTDDLPGLVARLREKRPDLKGRLPQRMGEWWGDPPGKPGSAISFISPATARAIVIGVCAEVLAEAGYGMVKYGAVWHAAPIIANRFQSMPRDPDFTTALVSAVIALAEEDRRMIQRLRDLSQRIYDHNGPPEYEPAASPEELDDAANAIERLSAALSAAEARVKVLEGERAWRKAVPEQEFEDGDRIVVAVACCHTDRGQLSTSARHFWEVSVLSVHCDEETPIRFEEANGDAWGWSWLDAEWWMPLRNLSSSLPPLAAAAARAEKEGDRNG